MHNVIQSLVIVNSIPTIIPLSRLHSSKRSEDADFEHRCITALMKNLVSSMLHWRKKQPWENDCSLSIGRSSKWGERKQGMDHSREGDGCLLPRTEPRLKPGSTGIPALPPNSSCKQFRPWLLAGWGPVQFTVVAHSSLTSQQTQALPKILPTGISLGWWGAWRQIC